MDVIDVNKGSLQEVEIKGHEEPKPFASGAELVRFMDENDMLFHMTEKEADVLLGYLGGYDFLLGEKDGKLYRGDLAYEQGKVRWLNDTIVLFVNLPAPVFSFFMQIKRRYRTKQSDIFFSRLFYPVPSCIILVM